MNRREALKKLASRAASLAALATVSAFLPVLAGCPISKSTLTNLLSTVKSALDRLLPILTGLSAPDLAAIDTSFAAVEAAVAAWNPGTGSAAVTSDIETAVNAFISAMGAIPAIAAYQPLVALVVATVEAIVADVEPAPAAAAGIILAMHAAPGVGVTRLPGGKLQVSYRGETVVDPPKTVHDFRAAWNWLAADAAAAGAKIDANVAAGLSQAVIERSLKI